jgi:hypothetical protein
VTCLPFSFGKGGGILCVDPSDGPFLITAGKKRWWFEWSDQWGPLRTRKDGSDAVQPGSQSRFWAATSLWARQGKRVDGKAALWEEPPPITHYYKRVGRSRVLVASRSAEGYDSAYSEEIYVEIPASADTLPKGHDAKQGLAGTESGAVPKADAQPKSGPSHVQ